MKVARKKEESDGLPPLPCQVIDFGIGNAQIAALDLVIGGHVDGTPGQSRVLQFGEAVVGRRGSCVRSHLVGTVSAKY